MMTWKRVPRFSSLCISQLKLEGSPQLRREGEGTDTGSSGKSLLSPAMGEVVGGGGACMVGLSCRTEHLGLFLLYVRGEPAMKQHQEISKFLNINAFSESSIKSIKNNTDR